MVIIIKSNGEPIYEEYSRNWEEKVKEYSKIKQIKEYDNLTIETREGMEVNEYLPLNVMPPVSGEIIYY